MPAPAHTPPHPASTGGVDIRLPWWALALPILAFLTLLTLILNPAHAGTAGADTGLTHVGEHAAQLIHHA